MRCEGEGYRALIRYNIASNNKTSLFFSNVSELRVGSEGLKIPLDSQTASSDTSENHSGRRSEETRRLITVNALIHRWGKLATPLCQSAVGLLCLKESLESKSISKLLRQRLANQTDYSANQIFKVSIVKLWFFWCPDNTWLGSDKRKSGLIRLLEIEHRRVRTASAYYCMCWYTALVMFSTKTCLYFVSGWDYLLFQRCAICLDH